MNGIIELDSEFGKQIGFTSDKFDGYLWREDGRVYISFIISRCPGQGNLSKLFAAIEERGLRVAVPTPLPLMQQILEAKGFEPHWERNEIDEVIEVWEGARP